MADADFAAGGDGPRRIMIVEDHPIFRLGLAELINQEPDLFVCGEAEDVSGALKKIPDLAPDLIVVDITLKGRNGIELIKETVRLHKGLQLLVLSMHDESLYAERALLAGARGYIMKQEASDSIVQAIRTVLSGRVYASEEILSGLLNRLVTRPDLQDKPAIESLTDRELEVFTLIGRGRTTREIADHLNLSVKTIGTYRDRIKQKLDLRSGAELIRRAVLWTEKDNFGTSDSDNVGR